MRKRQVSGRRGQRVAKWKRRCYMTHIGVVCDRPAVQKILPQFIIANEKTLPARRLAALRRDAPPNVVLVRQKPAWSNRTLTAHVLRQVAAAVAYHVGDIQIVLLLDAAKIHLYEIVLRACRAAGVWPIVVPPRMTFLLQPLDTHVFAVYKWRLLQAYQRARVASGSEGGDLDIAEFLPCVYEAISLSMERGCWAHAFSQDGFGRRQAALCASVRSQLGLEHAVDVDATRPTDAQVSLCFPRKFNVRLGLFLFDDRVPSASGEGQRSAASSGSSGGVPAASRGAASSSSSAAAARRPGSDSSIREPRTRAEHRAAKAAAKARCSV